MTEEEFYKAVLVACNDAGIDETGRCYVEMTCMENAFDADDGEFWNRSHDTLVWFIQTGDLVAVSRNER